ncbi:hypothetical protein BDY19DRAFT_915819, partial [Irpex rosettiformis]
SVSSHLTFLVSSYPPTRVEIHPTPPVPPRFTYFKFHTITKLTPLAAISHIIRM